MVLVSDVSRDVLNALLHSYGIELVLEDNESAIRGSYWGDSEAGIIGRTVYVRGDTPIHSLLHETCHLICMTEQRRSGLMRDAGGDELEESAVCYLQIVLADHVDGVGRAQLMLDMDAWGYSFRLGSSRSWFENDAEDAAEFLRNHGLLDAAGDARFQLRH